VRDRRLLLGLKQADVAREAGISPAYLNLIEHNRRRVGAALLEALAQALNTEAALLAEGAEGALYDALREAAAAATTTEVRPETDRIEDFVDRFPGWAGLLAARQAQVDGLARTVEQLSERMTQDPFLSASLHEVLSAITAIRSTSAILAEAGDVGPQWRERFHRNIHDDSVRLSNLSAGLVAWLDQLRSPESGLASPQEELESWLAACGWYVAGIEQQDGEPQSVIADAPELASAASRRLALAHVQQLAGDRSRLDLRALSAALTQQGFDPLRLAGTLDLPPPLVFRRIAALPAPGGAADLGVAFPEGAAYVACDASGALSFRRPAPGFPFPRFGAACALWPLFEAAQHPFTPIRRWLATAGRGAGARFLAHAWAERTFPEGAEGPAVLTAHMLVLPADSGQTGPFRTVGSTCRVCTKPECPARREPSILT
jgi:transcriptional regulator with XRE-family HTH domain